MMGNIDNETVVVTSQEIYIVIMKLDDNTAGGMNNITSEHLKHLLTICFTGLLVYLTLYYQFN